MIAERAPLDPVRLHAALVGPGRPWSDVVVLPTTGSTNADAAVLARDGAASGLVVTTDHQTAGRGRLGRSFSTPAGSCVVVSVVLRPGPDVPPAHWAWLPLLTGLAVADAVRDAGVDPAVKWPNDVLVDGRKISGILLERVETSDGPAAVLGVGLNVDLAADELPVPTATSLALAGAAVLDRAEVLVLLLDHLARHYAVWEASGPTALHEAYRRGCDTVGREVRVELPDGSTLTGVAEDVDVQGRLVVAGRPLSAGDVTHVRATAS